jgi:hypothetical protein
LTIKSSVRPFGQETGNHSKLGFPFSITGLIEVPTADPGIALERVANALEQRTSIVTWTERHRIEFSSPRIRGIGLALWSNPIAPLGRGFVHSENYAGGTRLVYRARMYAAVLTSLWLPLVLVILPLATDMPVSVSGTALPASIVWLGVVGGNYFRARIRFVDFLRQAAAAPTETGTS